MQNAIAEDMVAQTYNPSREAEMEGFGSKVSLGLQPQIITKKQNKTNGKECLLYSSLI